MVNTKENMTILGTSKSKDFTKCIHYSHASSDFKNDCDLLNLVQKSSCSVDRF